jgi:hypothetical protein
MLAWTMPNISRNIDEFGAIVPAPYPVINPALYQNPYWIVNRTETNENRDRVMGFVQLRYNLTDWLHISGRANLDKIKDEQERIFYNKTIGLSAPGGAFRTSRIDVTQEWFDVTWKERTISRKILKSTTE